MPHSCSGARFAVQRSKSALNDVKEKIDQNEEFLLTHPDDVNVKRRLQELRGLYETRKGEMDDAEIALAECEAQNEQ
jgi:hypothetical protein